MSVGISTKTVGSVVLLSLVAIAGGRLAASANALTVPSTVGTTANAAETEQAELSQNYLAQNTDTGCRQTNATTGVYGQPNLDSPSRGILATSQTVKLEVAATGTGWARITTPFVGWVEARYLTPPTACAGLDSIPGTQAALPTAGSPLSSQINTPPTQTSASGYVPNPANSVSAVCEVLPPEGLVVRSDPTVVSSNTLYTIPHGIHQFQFSGNTLTTRTAEGERRWVYITSPYQGWISLGYTGGGFNLGGRECG
jgi:hypothetical protein